MEYSVQMSNRKIYFKIFAGLVKATRMYLAKHVGVGMSNASPLSIAC